MVGKAVAGLTHTQAQTTTFLFFGLGPCWTVNYLLLAEIV